MINSKQCAAFTVMCVALLIFPRVVPAYEEHLLLENRTIDAGSCVTEIAIHTIAAGTSYVLEPGAHVTFVAGTQPGDRISLRPGFHVKAGASFRAGSGDMRVGEIHGSDTWSKTRYINGDLVVHPDASIVVCPGVEVVFLPESNGSLRVYGTLSAEGVTFTSSSSGPGVWNGIVVESSGVVYLRNVSIENARQGVTIKKGSEVRLFGCVFRNNFVGVHVIGANPSIVGNIFSSNTWYGIKEDAGGSPDELTDNVFSQNGNSYYNAASGVISMDVLNALFGLRGNVER